MPKVMFAVGGGLVLGFCGILVAALGALIARVLVYLPTGEWLHSACSAAAFFEVDTQGWCSVRTGWLGADKIYETLTNAWDVSGALFVVSLAFLFSGYVLVAMGADLDKKVG